MPKCDLCGRERGYEDTLDYNPSQVVFGAPLGWYSGTDGEVCSECLTKTIQGP